MKKLLITLMFVVVLSGCKGKNDDLTFAEIVERTSKIENVTLTSETGEDGIPTYTTTYNYDDTDIRFTGYDGAIVFYIMQGDEYVLLSETVSSQIYRGLIVSENYYPSILSVLYQSLKVEEIDDFIKDGNKYSLQVGEFITLVQVDDDNYITNITRMNTSSVYYSLTLSDFDSTEVIVPEYSIPD